MVKQLNLIPNPRPLKVTDYRVRKVTPKNEFIFKQEAAKWFQNKIIPKELYVKIQLTDYVKGNL